MNLRLFSIAVLTSGLASAGSLFTYTGGDGPFFNGMSGIGPAFHTDVSLTVSRLGAWTAGVTHNGDSPVYLADLDGNLIASATVPDLTAKEPDGYAWISIAPVVIGPGDYMVTARVFGFGDPLLRGSVQEGRWAVNLTPGSETGTVTGVSGVTFINGSYLYGGSGTPQLVAPNLFVVGGGLDVEAGGAAVPEPATAGLLSLGAIGVLLARKRLKSAARG